MTNMQLVLASSSPRRLELLSKISIIPDKIIAADIDETELPKELPNDLAIRLANSKAEKIALDIDKAYIIGADTVSAVGRRILPKALNDDEIRFCLKLLSGRRHRVYTAVTIIKKNGKEIIKRNRLVQTMVKLKHLSLEEIELYISSKEGLNKAGGFSIQGFAEAFIPSINGSYSNVLGLPLLETRNMLLSLGFFTKE